MLRGFEVIIDIKPFIWRKKALIKQSVFPYV
jgi:hypothetical protein